MRRSEGFFHGFEDLELFFQLWQPVHNSKGLIVITHGHGEHSDAYIRLVEAIKDLGYSFLAWDLRGHGRSEGQRGFAHKFTDYTRDFELLYQSVLPTIDPQSPRIFFAHSMGALVQLKALSNLPEGVLQTQILSSPFLEKSIEVPLAKDLAAAVFRDFLPRVTLSTGVQEKDLSRDPQVLEEYRHDPLRHSKMSAGVYLGSLEAQKSLLAKPKIWRGPVLMLLAENDPVVRTRTNLNFFEGLSVQHKSCSVFPQMKHELVNDLGREKVFEKIREFLVSLR